MSEPHNWNDALTDLGNFLLTHHTQTIWMDATLPGELPLPDTLYYEIRDSNRLLDLTATVVEAMDRAGLRASLGDPRSPRDRAYLAVKELEATASRSNDSVQLPKTPADYIVLFKAAIDTQADGATTAGGKSVQTESAVDNGISTTRKTEPLEEYVGSNSATLTIVFTDIVGSVAMKTTLGDYEYGIRRNAHVQQAELLLTEHRGHKVKWLGDGLLAVFKANEHALDFALALLRNTGHESIQLRIGIHVGSIGIEDHDVNGSTVDFAKRVQEKATASSVFVSNHFKDEIDKIGRPEHRNILGKRHDDQLLKGFDGNHTLWEVA